MAKVIVDDPEHQVKDWVIWVRITVIGLAIGLGHLLLTWVLSRFIVGPISCSAEDIFCGDTLTTSANIATILVAAGGVAWLIRLRWVHPVLIAAGAAALTWGVIGWMDGLRWPVIAAWDLLLYGAAYLLSGWLAVHFRLITGVLFIAVIFAISRVLVTV